MQNEDSLGPIHVAGWFQLKSAEIDTGSSLFANAVFISLRQAPLQSSQHPTSQPIVKIPGQFTLRIDLEL